MPVPSQRNRRKTVLTSVRYLVLAAMLTALSVVIGMLCKSFLNFAGGLFRITFENLPILLAGVFLGPLAGGLVGLTSDLVSYFLSPQIYPPNLTVTLGACTVGVVSGLVARYAVKTRGPRQFILAGGCAHVLGSMIIKTAGLYQFYGWAVLVRFPLYVVIAALEIILLCLLWRRAAFRKLFERL